MPRQERTAAINGTVPNRRENDRLRAGRKHLTEPEIEKLMATARKFGRYGHRDATAILITYAHGLRVGELAKLQWTQIDFQRSTIQVGRYCGVGRRSRRNILGFLVGDWLSGRRGFTRRGGAIGIR